mgnify:FL=1|jgi:hypothetical protein
MAKQFFKVGDFSGGLNTSAGPKEISNNECTHIQNMICDSKGILKTAGALEAHSSHVITNKDIDQVDNSSGIADASGSNGQFDCSILNVGGFGLFYFETDHDSVAVSVTQDMTAVPASAGGTYAEMWQDDMVVE